MTVHPHTPLKFDNLVEGETIHQVDITYIFLTYLLIC